MFNDELDILEVNYSRIYWAREEGREEGQLQASYSIARNMLTKHMSDEDIAELTALPLTTIAQLRSQLETGA
ncbi:TPA: hypothetical protein ACGOVL_001344 [Streptococcus suis]|uniref:hypothetical protein n=1 Tax=Streptococcus sp. A23 TaxID=3373127 RepID=UPI0037074A2C